MPRIIRHTFESAFQRRLVGVTVLAKPNVFGVLSSLRYINDPYGYQTVQCQSEKVAAKLLKEYYGSAYMADESIFNRIYNQLDYSHIDFNKSVMINNLDRHAPSWGECREWLNDNIEGSVSVLLTTKIKRLSFVSDGDHMLFKLAWT